MQFVCNRGKSFKAVKIRPNSICRCGSGKKAKQCCGTSTTYYVKKDPIKENPEGKPLDD